MARKQERLGLTLSLLALLLFGGACATPGSSSTSPNSRPVEPLPASWASEPLSWAKLQRIEGWLESGAARHAPESVPGAELELAQGRVEMTRRDGATTSEGVVQHRLDLAEAGFRRVLADEHARPWQRSQAERGLEDVDRLRDEAPASADLVTLGPILPRTAWGAAPPDPSHLDANTYRWNRITVHHSATESTDPSVVRRIQKNHMEGRGFGDIGYHFLIDARGKIYQGRSLRWQGAHAYGANNIANIGICLLGDFDSHPPTEAALRSLEGLVDALRERHQIARARVVGHRELKATDCPGRYLEEWVREYRTGHPLAHAPARHGDRSAIASIR